MSTLHRAAAAMLFILAACAPASTSTDTAADEQAIRGRIDSWNQALSSQNDSLIAGIYAEDAVMMPPAMPRISGRANIRDFYAQNWAMKGSLTLTPAGIRVSGDWAIVEGNWTWTMPSPQGEIRDHGKYLETWRRTDTSWEVVQDIWNSDIAPPVPAAK